MRKVNVERLKNSIEDKINKIYFYENIACISVSCIEWFRLIVAYLTKIEQSQNQTGYQYQLSESHPSRILLFYQTHVFSSKLRN